MPILCYCFSPAADICSASPVLYLHWMNKVLDGVQVSVLSQKLCFAKQFLHFLAHEGVHFSKLGSKDYEAMDMSSYVSLVSCFGAHVTEHGKPRIIISSKSPIRLISLWYYMVTNTIGIKVMPKMMLKGTLLLKSNVFPFCKIQYT